MAGATLAGVATAQDTNVALTLEECVGVALKNNPAMEVARTGVAAADESAGEARAGYYPRLSANAGYSRWTKLAFMPSGLTLPPETSDLIGPTDDWMAGLTAQWTLFDSGERGGKRKATQATRKAMESMERQTRQDVVMAVHQAFFEYLAAQESRQVADDGLVRAADHLKLATDRVKAGAAAQADESRAQVEVANAKLGVLRAESRLRIAQGRLNTAMGLPAENSIRIVKPGTDVTAPGGLKISEIMDTASKNRPDLQVALQRVEAARGDVSTAKSTFGPKVTVQGSYDRREGDLAGPGDEWLVGVSVDLPLFSGFGTVHRVSRAKATLSQAEAVGQQQVLNARQEVWAAYSRLLESYQAVQATTAQVADAQESVRRATERYQAGAGIMADLLDAETALAQSEAGRIDAQKDYFVASAAFKKAMGVLIVEK